MQTKFITRNLSVLSYANGITLWLYRADIIDDTRASDFFAPAKDLLAIGDIILISAPDGARQVSIVRGDGDVCVREMMTC